jgi:hypothetical protein
MSELAEINRGWKKLEQNLATKNRGTPLSGVVIGPDKSALLQWTIGISMPFRDLLQQLGPNGRKAIDDDTLLLMLREMDLEVKTRGLKP